MANGNSTKRAHNFKDLTGQTFGKWTVLEFFSIDKYLKSQWLCRCECGIEKPVVAAQLGSGISRGCRHCAVKTHGQSYSQEYRVWHDMLARCRNPELNNYARYGGRGIMVCEEWQVFENFFADMGSRPSPRHSIERKNNDGDYEPNNCMWATLKQQARNTRRNRMLTLDGKTMCLAAWAEEIGINRKTLSYRLRNGWSVEKTLTTPVHVKYRKS